jgi:fucose 4-O-acetylase-like acetyltransferase
LELILNSKKSKGEIILPTITARNYHLDNVKALLITLVVLGHLMDRFTEIESFKFFWILIYSFHMPLFVFCSGYFASTDNKKITKRLIYPYILFQILFLIFDKYIIKMEVTSFTLITPIWILWYLLASVFWSIMIQFIKKIDLKVIIIAFIIGLLAGFDDSIGFDLSLSRTIVFFPFFLIGYYCRNNKIDVTKLKENKVLIIILSILSTLVILYLYINCNNINGVWLNASRGYEAFEYNLIIRLIIYLNALILSAMIFVIIPKFKIPAITNIGVNSMSIYLLHGFIVRYLANEFHFKILSSNIKIAGYLIITTTTIVIILSSKYIVKPLSKILPK